jgi:hypothetical protein
VPGKRPACVRCTGESVALAFEPATTIVEPDILIDAEHPRTQKLRAIAVTGANAPGQLEHLGAMVAQYRHESTQDASSLMTPTEGELTFGSQIYRPAPDRTPLGRRRFCYGLFLDETSPD